MTDFHRFACDDCKVTFAAGGTSALGPDELCQNPQLVMDHIKYNHLGHSIRLENCQYPQQNVKSKDYTHENVYGTTSCAY